MASTFLCVIKKEGYTPGKEPTHHETVSVSAGRFVFGLLMIIEKYLLKHVVRPAKAGCHEHRNNTEQVYMHTEFSWLAWKGHIQAKTTICSKTLEV